jgi:ribosome-associated toxin RatA of RatAB toxin-antitoxin module
MDSVSRVGVRGGAHAGGRLGVRRRVVLSAVLAGAVVAHVAAAPADPVVDVRHTADGYTVSATFTVAQPSSVVFATLTDYEHIPRFLPDVRVSQVLERTADRVLVEQEAVSKFMMFSKRVHLVLEIRQDAHAIRFADRCGKSFARYEGAWVIRDTGGQTVVTYELAARPSFDVPDFVLRRLLKRDAVRLIERLTQEIAARSRQS